MWANFQRIIELFTKKIVTKLSKIWVWDPGSEIQDPGSGKTYSGSWITDPGIKKAPDPGSGSATLLEADTASLAHANMNEASTLWCVAYEIADGLPLDADVGGEDVVPHLQRDGL